MSVCVSSALAEPFRQSVVMREAHAKEAPPKVEATVVSVYASPPAKC